MRLPDAVHAVEWCSDGWRTARNFDKALKSHQQRWTHFSASQWPVLLSLCVSDFMWQDRAGDVTPYRLSAQSLMSLIVVCEWLKDVSQCWTGWNVSLLYTLQFIWSPSQVLFCCRKYTLKHHMCVNPLLKIVPDKFTIYTCLNAVY